MWREGSAVVDAGRRAKSIASLNWLWTHRGMCVKLSARFESISSWAGQAPCPAKRKAGWVRTNGCLCHGTNLTCPHKMATLLADSVWLPTLSLQDGASIHTRLWLFFQESPHPPPAFLGHTSPNPSLKRASQHCLAWSVGRKEAGESGLPWNSLTRKTASVQRL